MIEAVIFDMDGVIIDSEPLWTEAQEAIFTSLGVNYDRKVAENTVGLNAHDTIDFWFTRQPWQDKTYKEVEQLICSRMLNLIEERGKANPGINELLAFLKDKQVKVGLASGSPKYMIQAVLDKLTLAEHFEVIHSADDEQYGKPNPAIFLSAARMLKAAPLNCIVFEDSFNGLIAAKSARMRAIAYMPGSGIPSTRFDFADLKLKSFHDFDETQFNYLQNLM